MPPLKRQLLWSARLLLVLVVVLSGCGGGSEESSADSAGAPSASEDRGEQAADAGTVAPASEPASEPASGDGGDGGDPVGALEPSEPFALAEITLRSPEGDGTAVPVYVAAEPQTRQRGLMFREELPAGTGMVFVFPGETSGGFWMANTLIPLSIAFYDADGTVVSVLDMEPCTEEDLNDCPSYDPGAAYSGALEVNQGFFDEIGLVEGWTVELPGDLPEGT